MNLILLFIAHFIADFLLQSREMGQKKSQYFKWLMGHLFIQYFVMLAFVLGITGGDWKTATFFSLLNTIIHGIIDWYIWKFYKLHAIRIIKRDRIKVRDFKYWEDHMFYTTIGFDQLLHTATIVGLYGFFRI